MTAFRGLLWKDSRLARAYLICGAAVVLAPHAFLGYARLRYGGVLNDEFNWGRTLYFTGLVEGIASLIVIALLAGASFATERADRSVEFLAYLPVSRAARLVSKLLVAACPIVALAAGNPLVVYDALLGLIDAGDGTHELLNTLACTGVMVFGAAWLSSVRVTSAAALLLGLLSPFIVTCLFYSYVETRHALGGLQDVQASMEAWFPTFYRRTGVALGVLSWVLGTWQFLHRSET